MHGRGACVLLHLCATIHARLNCRMPVLLCSLAETNPTEWQAWPSTQNMECNWTVMDGVVTRRITGRRSGPTHLPAEAAELLGGHGDRHPEKRPSIPDESVEKLMRQPRTKTRQESRVFCTSPPARCCFRPKPTAPATHPAAPAPRRGVNLRSTRSDPLLIRAADC